MSKFLSIYIAFILIFTISIADHAKAQYSYTYRYDENNRLKSVLKDGVVLVSFIYDNIGNLTNRVYPFVPSNLSASNFTESSINLSWEEVKGANGYKIYQDDFLINATTSTNYEITNLLDSTSYTFKVTAANSLWEEGNTSNPITVKTAPLPPTGLSSSNIQQTTFTLNWLPSNGATSYSIYKVDPNSTVKNLIATTAFTSYTISALSAGTSYSFYIKAYNGNYSNYSEGLTVTTLEASDTYEPNNTSSEAYPISLFTSYYSYIFNSTDGDYYTFTNYSSNDLYVSLTVPPSNDYDLYVYKNDILNGGFTLVGSSTKGVGRSESVSNYV